MRDSVAGWFRLHPSELASLDQRTVARMAEHLAASPAPRAGRPDGSGRSVELGDFRLDRDARTVHVAGRRLHFTEREFDLLSALLSRVGAVRSRAYLIGRTWGTDAARHETSLSVYMRRLRQKLDDGQTLPFRIVTVRGYGYRIDVDDVHDPDAEQPDPPRARIVRLR